MKKFLLSAALLGGVLGAEAQVMFSTDFESPTYTLGDFTGAQDTSDPTKTNVYFAQNGFKINAGTTGLTPANYQIEAGTGTNTTNVLRMTGYPTPGTVKVNTIYFDYQGQWSGNGTITKTRLDGNDVIELQCDLWIPATTTSTDYLQVRISGTSEIAWIAMSPRNNTTGTILRGITPTGNVPGNAIGSAIPKSTWQRVKITCNTVTGEVQTLINGVIGTQAGNGPTIIPRYLDIVLRNDGSTTTTTASVLKIDNITVTATPTSTLGTKEIYRENNDVAVYLNHNQLEISSKIAVEALEVYNLAGQLVASQANSNSIDVSALGKGTYVAKYQDKKQTYSKRFIK